jgi:hypothetical protein
VLGRLRKDWLSLLPAAMGALCVALCLAIALAPVFRDLTSYGGHDWDEMSAHRLLTVKALLQYGQLPLWNPYACGGYSEWGNVQGASNLVSPFLPFYLLLELRHALRVELVGSAVLAAAGTWLLAGEFTRSTAARTFSCLVCVVNGRFALQAGTGHLWHLQYCYLPWALWAFERMLRDERPRLRYLCCGAGAFAAMLYSGGIYPLPQSALLLGVYAASRAATERTGRPLLAFATIGGFAVGLAAPKLFSVALEFTERPRLVPSTEAINGRILWQALVATGQTPGSHPVPIPQWGWHEYGIYIGFPAALLVVLGALWWEPPRALSLKVAGIVALVLGFGAFHELSPWALLHQLSVFRSQHVPTRWLYPALLLFGVAAAAGLGSLLSRVPRRRNAELLCLAGCLLLAIDIGRESSTALARAFWMQPRSVAPAAAFEQFERVPRSLQYQRRDYAPEAVPAMLAGIGVVQCTMHASLNIWAPKAADGRPFGMGARGRDTKQYAGEAYTASGSGTARIVSFSPNRVEVEVRGARADDRVVLNQNFDPGWSVDGRRTEPHQNAVSIPVSASTARVSFRFWPRGLTLGLVVLLLTLAGLAALHWRRASAARFSP